MNEKTIKKVLEKKHKAFCESITDASVKKLIEKNTIISGGCITSMFFNEKVNDYDLYFTDSETVSAAVEYYINQWQELHPRSAITLQKREWEDSFGELRIGVFIESAGVAGSEESEYKYFESDPQDQAEQYVDDIIKDDEIPGEVDKSGIKFRPIFMTSNAITLSNKIQLITRFYGSAKMIHKNFDFIHATNYWQSEGNALVLNKKALSSILSKNLFYSGSLYPVSSVIRTRKFIHRGWHINAGQYIKMLFQVSKLDLSDIEILKDQLVGVDNSYFYQVIEFFKKKQEENENFKIDGTYLATIIDRIF